MPEYIVDFPQNPDTNRKELFDKLVARFGKRIVRCPEPNAIETTDTFSSEELQEANNILKPRDLEKEVDELTQKVANLEAKSAK